MVDRYQNIIDALQQEDWRCWLDAVDDLIELLREPGRVSEVDAEELVEKFTASSMKWEVKQALAKKSNRLSFAWASRILSRLISDSNQYVRQTARRVRRLREQTRLTSEENESESRELETLVARATKAGGADSARMIRELVFEAQNQALGEFTHELKNVIQRVIGPVNRLKRKLTVKERERLGLQEIITDLNDGATALRTFSKNLQWVSEGKEPEFTKMSTNDVIRHVVDSVKPKRKIKIRAPRREDILFDGVEERLIRALVNILRNSVEASPSGGVIVMDVRLSTDREEVVFRIADQGPGIPEEMREEIFKLGKTTKQAKGRHGMGLYLARQVIVVEHGGDVNVEEGPEGGAAFFVRIPLAASKSRD